MKPTIRGAQRIGTYIHRDGRKVDMRAGLMRIEKGKRERWQHVFFYVSKRRVVVVSREELANNWINKIGNHVLGTAVSYQQDLFAYTGEKQDLSWDAWKCKK